MLKLIIEDDEGRKTVVPFVRDEITIGRQEGNTIRLTERNVSRRHARLLRASGAVVVEDLGSYNGIRVNGEKLVGRASIKDGDLIQIGDYDLAIQHEGAEQPTPAPVPPPDATHPAHPVQGRGMNGAAAHRAPAPVPVVEEPETEASSPVYDAEPLGEGEEDTAPSSKAEADLSRRHATSIIRVDQVEAQRHRQVVNIDPEEAPRLVVVNTEFAGREFACIRSELRIGRTDDNDINLDHRSLSRTHAKLVREENGEWRIIDLQSANGMMVNGEQYAQATLHHLDTVELGHLKMKFVGAGESYSYSAGAEDRPAGAPGAPGKSKLPILLGVGAVVAVLAGIGVFVAVSGGSKDTPKPPQVANQLPGPAKQDGPRPDSAGTTAAAQQQPPQPKAPEKVEAPKEDPAITAAAEAKQKLSTAQEAIAEGDLDRAVEVLEAARKVPNLTKPMVAELDEELQRAKGEKIMQTRLDDAQKAIAAGKYEHAQKLIADSSATEVFADRRRDLEDLLLAELEREAEAQRAATAAAAAKKDPTPVKTEKVVAKETARSTDDEAARLFDEGKRHLEKKQNREARASLKQCVVANPRYSKCHLLLGAAHAKLGEMDEGAKHYEIFLKLAPDAPEAPKVRVMLEQYKSSRKSQ